MKKEISFLKKHRYLLVAVSLPVLIISFMFIVWTISKLSFIYPQYDFYYANISQDTFNEVFEVNGDKIFLKNKYLKCKESISTETGESRNDKYYYPTDHQTYDCYQVRTLQFYKYSVSDNESTLISLDEMNKLKLNFNDKSPDGYVVEFISKDNLISNIFGFYGKLPFLKKDAMQKNIKLETNHYDFYLIGWEANE